MEQTSYLNIHNYNLSVILTYDLVKAFIHNHQFFESYLDRNGLEVIILINKMVEISGLEKLIKDNMFISWKIVTCNATNPLVMIAVGIQNSTKKFIYLINSDLEQSLKTLCHARQMVKAFILDFLIGTNSQNYQMDQSPYSISPGILLMQRKLFRAEKYTSNITFTTFLRSIIIDLQQMGYKGIFYPTNLDSEKYYNPSSKFIANKTEEIFGEAYSEIIYDWNSREYNFEQFIHYSKNFLHVEWSSDEIFTTHFQKLLLVQCYNEANFINGFLANMDQHFDAIIFMDDCSTDNSWELFNSNKVVLKIKKLREKFDDLGNRNVLLDFSSFLSADWLCFMDIDERIDSRFCNFDSFINNKNYKTATFSFVHMWDNGQYKIDFPGTNAGFFKRYRMFRAISKRLQIYSDSDLHFSASPYFDQTYDAPILIRHLGTINAQLRIKKFNFYLLEDKSFNERSGYMPLLSEQNRLGNIEEIIYQNDTFINQDHEQ